MSTLSSLPSAYGFFRDFPSLPRLSRSFPQHYLLYASRGAVRLEIESTTWLLPPQRAAWIAAGTDICVTSKAPFTACSVLFDPGVFPAPDFACRVFTMSALAREMTQYAMRWGADRDPSDAVANSFFVALAAVCAELYARPDHFWLPQARSPELKRVIDDVMSRLAHPLALADAARIAAVSERTLARRFSEETAMTWRQFLRRARMIRAMELLAREQSKIIDVAFASGFESQSAFIAAFREFVGETPSQFRQRCR